MLKSFNELENRNLYYFLFKPSLTTYIILIPITFVISKIVKDVDFLRIAEAIELTPYFILGIVIYQHTQLFLKKSFLGKVFKEKFLRNMWAL